jgi:uncharacterized RDD family membrane protein YckC
VTGFREHFLDKYFGYRRRYVAAIADRAPNRRSLAVASEIARLGFSTFANLLCAAILWLLFAGALGRLGMLAVWPIVFGLLALLPTCFAVLALRGLGAALADRS